MTKQVQEGEGGVQGDSQVSRVGHGWVERTLRRLNHGRRAGSWGKGKSEFELETCRVSLRPWRGRPSQRRSLPGRV